MMVMGCLDLLMALLEIMLILIRKWSPSHGVLAEKDGGHTLEFNSCLPASGTLVSMAQSTNHTATHLPAFAGSSGWFAESPHARSLSVVPPHVELSSAKAGCRQDLDGISSVSCRRHRRASI